MSITKLILVDDHQLILDAITLLVEGDSSIKVIKTFTSGIELLNWLEHHLSSDFLILLDLIMPEMSGVECAKILKQKYPDNKLAILSMESDPKIIHEIINEIGVNGFMSKGIKREELKAAIHQIMENDLYLSPDIENFLINYKKYIIEIEDMKLTARENQIVGLMCKGFMNTEIAEKLFISEGTVATHRKNIYRKTETHNVGQLIEKLKY